jgi:predicted permease
MPQLLISILLGFGLLIALGYYFGRQNLMDRSSVSGLAWLIIDVTMPALFFTGVLKNGFILQNKAFIVSFLGGTLVPCVGLLLAWPTFRFFPLENKQKGAIYFDSCVGNSSFIPLPICAALWGTEGSLACLAYILGNNIFLFTVGIGLLRGLKRPEKREILRIIMHPQGLAFALGLTFFYFKIQLPNWLFQPIEDLGKATLPLAMVVTGAILAQERHQWKGKARLFSALTLLKLGALPFLAFICLKPFKYGPFGGIAASVVLLQAAMPSLASAGVYARRFGGDAALAASGSLLTTLLCPLSIPLWMMWWG